MDTWILIGLVFVFLLVLAPILAIIAINRTGRMQYQISLLNQKVSSLEAQLLNAKYTPSISVDSVTSSQSGLDEIQNTHIEQEGSESLSGVDAKQDKQQEISSMSHVTYLPVEKEHDLSDTENSPLIREQTTHENSLNHPLSNESINPNRFDNTQAQRVDANRFNQNQPETKQNTASDDKSIFNHFFSWLMKGNPVAKIGILLLFLGVAYLLNYSVQNEIISPQMRLIFSAVGCLALLGTGWWLRNKKALFGLILQGGAIGCLYITIFAAFKLYTMMPYGMAFAFMLLICAASIALALLQRTISLAVLASIGGYLAPILLSTGGGSHVVLFSYYLMLSIGILVISVWQAWRPLNLVGMVMTYGVAILWGLDNYQSDYYLSCQLFIIANLVVFNALTQLFSLRFEHSKQLVVDNTLLFVPPFISIALQFFISEGEGLLPAFISLIVGLLYLITGLQVHKRYKSAGKNMALANIIIGAGFITLAIPLALTFEWTSIIWSLEGLLILWFGLQQNQKKMAAIGSLLIVISAITLLSDYPYLYWSRSSTYMVPVLLIACFMAGGLFHIRRKEDSNFTLFSYGFLIIGLVTWLCWLPLFTDILSWSRESEGFIILVLVVISVWFWRLYAIYINWVPLLLCQSILWIAGYYYLGLDFLNDQNPMGRGEGSLIWPVVLGSSVLFVIHAYKLRDRWMQRILHSANLWLILAFITTQVNWFVSILPWGMHEMGYFIYVMAITLTVIVLYWLQQNRMPPMKRNGLIYWYSMTPVAIGLIILSGYANLEDGKLTFWNYIPLINPLDEAGLFSIATLVLIRKGLSQKIRKVTAVNFWVLRSLLVVTIALSAYWFNGILIRAIADFAELNWSYDTLYDSRLVQTVLSISWALAALACIIIASIKKNRIWWFMGAGIFACVIAKLFLIDIYGQGGISRAISFIGVALLILIVGYFSPLPPKDTKGKVEKEIQP
ncbi:DUF2339 domain-containing protein [Providencia rettgeri]|uniref:DUF2339 domain-containing protein n=1 Tax=Providencia sp. PROV247 TaxID=2949938 RepID=UPI0013939A0F|nr:DUF2339 domain-containing protein [Providencia sp. PROV247]MRF66449.1 DUF2339 domain-containing protein [Escherichia coli]